MSTLPLTTFQNIAHRGARAYAPENTLAAFKKCKDFGCTMFEMDVQLSKDNEIVVFHDNDLLRCSNAKIIYPNCFDYLIENFSLKELKKLDVGSWFVAQLKLPNGERQRFLQSLTDDECSAFVSPEDQAYYASGAIEIPTLKEALSLAKASGLLVNIELKSNSNNDLALISGVIKHVYSMNMIEDVIISSFNPALVKYSHDLSSQIATAILTENPITEPLAYLKQTHANFYHLGRYKGYDDMRFEDEAGMQYLDHVTAISLAGVNVNVWTCNNANEMTSLLRAGVKGIISDYANRVQIVIAESASQNGTPSNSI